MKRAGYGSRQSQVLAEIRRAESSGVEWTITGIAEALHMTRQQASSVVQALAASGRLVRGQRVVTVDTLVSAVAQ